MHIPRRHHCRQKQSSKRQCWKDCMLSIFLRDSSPCYEYIACKMNEFIGSLGHAPLYLFVSHTTRKGLLRGWFRPWNLKLWGRHCSKPCFLHTVCRQQQVRHLFCICRFPRGSRTTASHIFALKKRGSCVIEAFATLWLCCSWKHITEIIDDNMVSSIHQETSLHRTVERSVRMTSGTVRSRRTNVLACPGSPCRSHRAWLVGHPDTGSHQICRIRVEAGSHWVKVAGRTGATFTQGWPTEIWCQIHWCTRCPGGGNLFCFSFFFIAEPCKQYTGGLKIIQFAPKFLLEGGWNSG